MQIPRFVQIGLISIGLIACADEDPSRHSDATAVAGDPACEGSLGCLHLTQHLLLGDIDGPGMIESEAGTAQMDSRGRFYVYAEFGQDFKVFSPSGEYLKTVGRAGGGPGEFLGLSFVRPGPEDSLHMVDLLNMRWSVFSPDHEYVRSAQLGVPVYMQLHLLPDGRGLFSAPVRGELALYPLHLLDASGEHVRSFGAVPEEFESIGVDAEWRKITPAGPTSVWAAFLDRYRIELWDAAVEDEQPKHVVERSVDWFPAGVPEAISLKEPPVTRLQAVRQDSAGRLLVLLHTADVRWREVVAPGAAHPNVTDPVRYRNSRIEMLDPESGELLASAEHDLVFHGFIADDLLVAPVLDETLSPRVAVWRMTLDGER